MKVMKAMVMVLLLSVLFSSCFRVEEVSLKEWESITVAGLYELLTMTQSRPWRGEEFVSGPPGGVWNSAVVAEPKTFNLLVAERDAPSNTIVRMMLDSLLDYDMVRREWTPRAASFEIEVDEAAGTLRVIYTLRDDLYWSFYNSDRKVPVTSNDVIFWYNEIQGDRAFLSSAFNSQFIMLEDGSAARVTIERINDKRFAFFFPRIVADPLLSTNMTFGPSFIFEEAKRERGVQGVMDLFSIASDPREIPSFGRWFLIEYVPGLRMVFRRNPNHWERDDTGFSFPYASENIVQILPDTGTQFLVFQEGRLDTYGARPEDLDVLIRGQGRGRNNRIRSNRGDYTVFNAEGSLGAPLWSFNQNPRNKDQPFYEWFTQKEFRQAMSSILNRDRIVSQVFRGLAEPKLDFFPAPNPFYNPDIRLQFTYDPQRAIELLASIGMNRDVAGVMRDAQGRAVEFDLSISSDVTILSDTASIIADEAAKIGIRITIRPTDFQRLVDQLTNTYDWSSVIIALGANLFPSQGSNVWPSSGNLHLWHPLQTEPATYWEARIDFLYNEGSFTVDPEKAWVIWDEFQSIILEYLPVIYLIRSRSFFAIQNRWDFTNFYFDNLNGAEISYLFLRSH
ncbi:MAG: ABC transporter substrate-binding protein [Spirochaetaceae bacterium]|nr:ABC transporter substrate-binding protein [Spirochaetaceae bacterium]